MAGIAAKKVKKWKTPAVLQHYDEVPEVLPDGDFKPKCKYCGKEITGSTGVTTNYCSSRVYNPAKHWRENQKKYPFLAMLAKDVLGVPSSSAPVEWLFSIAAIYSREMLAH